MYKINLPDDVKFILKTLNKHGEGILVGGCIRDALLGLTPKDYDFSTNISYEKLLDIFKEYHPKEIGKAFGIIQIKVNGVHYEIAKYRTESNHSNNRRELDVKFVSNFYEDIERRDFTFNGLVYNGEDIIDCFIGVGDLKKGLVSFIGNANDRIIEDPLRMLRAVRFANRFNFKINTIDSIAIKRNSSLLPSISKERIREEFNKILLSKKPSNGIKELYNQRLLKYIIPELYDCIDFDQNNLHHNKTVYEHLLSVLDNTKPILVNRLSALFHDIAKPKCYTIENGVGHFYGHDKESVIIAETIMRRLKYDNKTIETVCIMINNHMSKHHKVTDKAIKKFINRVGIDNLDSMFDLMRADILGSVSPYSFGSLDELVRKSYKIIYSKEPTKTKDLAINGRDIMELGIKEGKVIGELLGKCMEYVLEYPKENNKEGLIKFIGGINDYKRD